MRIGPHPLKNNLVVAPMAGITDLPFRRLCKRFGAGLTVSEMVSANSTLHGHRKTQRRLALNGEPGPVSVQILGADPQRMAQAARLHAEQGAHLIDINMGCPAKKVLKTAAGSALLRDEALIGRILEAVVKAVDIPVTLKIRTGWDPSRRNGVRVAQIAEQAGIQALAVHGRTRACGFSGQAEYDTIRDIKHTVAIPVIANGDIRSPQDAKQVLDYTGADGIMVGRAAQGQPWLFRDIQHYLETGETPAPPSAVQIRDILLEHLDELYSFYGETQGVRMARKHIAWYSRSLPGAAEFRKNINVCDSITSQRALIDAFFNHTATIKGLAA